ncbi:MAG: DUF3108 domain-containing protein [FCB group bacterium]|nr:DUF3108 domain-containing protein [FCB group bacterium]
MRFSGILLFSLLTNLTAIFGQQDSTYTSEKLLFSAGFRWFSAGEASMIMKKDTLGGEVVLQMISETRSNSLLDRFYRVRDKISVWIDPRDYSLLKMVKNIHEGKYRRKHTAVIDTLNNLAVSEKGSVAFKGRLYDPFTIIYALRNENLLVGKTFHYSSYDNGKVKEIYVVVSEKQRMAVPAGIYNCFVIYPASENGKPLLKNKGQMKVWISDDQSKLPIRIEQKTSVGSMLLELKEVVYTTLKEPGYIIEHDQEEQGEEE